MSSSSCQIGESDASLSSGWVEDFLIEFYLEGHGAILPTDNATDLQNEHEERLCVGSDVSAEVYDNYDADVENQRESRNVKDFCEARQHPIASEEDEKLLEAWQAQYGQVVRVDAEAELCPRAIGLWNWSTIVSRGECKYKTSTRLLGQLAQNSGRLHHSLQHHKGFFKTSEVCQVNLDLVKVKSGEIFRLRQPSLKYLSSVSLYDASNPTKYWNFPRITFLGLEDTGEHSETRAHAALKLSSNSSVKKPFTPNWNHHRYQQFNDVKVASPVVPTELRALSAGERASVEERKRKYRDRAKERRDHCNDYEEELESDMHGTEEERFSLDKVADNATEEKSKRHLVGRQMLEKMGWCEGESIGKRKDGLIRPLDAAGNHGRAGIGWNAENNLHS